MNDYFTFFDVKHFELPLCMKCAIQINLPCLTGHLNVVSVHHKYDEAVYCEGFVVLYHASGLDSITDYNG